jgi:SAM-dependent methyltransferase
MSEKQDRAGDASYFNLNYFGGGNYWKGYENYGKRSFWASTLDAIHKHLPDVEHQHFLDFLDIGSAYGFLLKHESEFKSVFQNVSITGVDISRPALTMSKSVAPNAHIAEVNLDTEPLPFANRTFDCVTALDVAEHLHDFKGGIKEMVRVLKQGGLFIIGTPVTDTPEGKLWSKIDEDLSHVSKPTRNYLLDTLQESGLEILESNYYFPLPWRKIPFPRTNMEVVAKKVS